MARFTVDSSLLNLAGEPFLFTVVGKTDDELTPHPHSHPRGQLFGSNLGVLTVGVEEAVWIVPAIHAVWLPPRHVHWGRSHGNFDGWSVYIAEAHCADLPASPRTIRTTGLLREAVRRSSTWPIATLTAAQRRIAMVICDEIRSLPSDAFGLPMPVSEGLARIARSLIADPSDDRGLEAWARWNGMGARTLSRRFVAETGFTFTAWRQRARLLRALEMLAAGLPVTTIALDLGFSTSSAFIALFRQTFGETPAVYRRRL
ncbi:helix-turn-helix transcriptional regulator [Amorphus sp. 3PC139-8]|uniref:AraC family transcriptional regulator n=1 Tax=Amorphus sp. 3PC139-8 TaxID=2735676 RepID=UPI00345DAAD1